MLYTPVTKIALKLCFDAHKDQLDKSGLPYVFHPFHLAEQMETEYEVCAALLHDVMEDTNTSPEQLVAAGIPETYVNTLGLLTHKDGVAYMDYVEALKGDPVARKVKIADLRHNSDLSRLDHEPTKADIARYRKYERALQLLEG